MSADPHDNVNVDNPIARLGERDDLHQAARRWPLEAWRQACVRLTQEASAAIMEIYQSPIEITLKDDQSPLTRADLASHALIEHGLKQLTPHIPIVSEESIDTQDFGPTDTYWLVDPLDGTKEFIARNGEFTVNIALIHLTQPLLSVVGIPAQQRQLSAIASQGAYLTDATLHTRALSALTPTQSRLRVLASRSHGSPQLTSFLSQLPAHTLQSAGSALKFTRIAEGLADVYPRLGPTSYWDTAAGQLIVEAVGGLVVDATGAAMRYPWPVTPPLHWLNGDFLAVSHRSLLASLPWEALHGKISR